MKYRKLLTLLLCTTLVFAGCGSASVTSETSDDSEVSNETVSSETTANGHATVNGVTLTEGKYSEEKLDAAWDTASAATITLSSTSECSDDEAVSISDNIITITKAGTYIIEGKLKNGQIIVDAPKDSELKLVLNGASIHSESASALYIKEGKTVITLAEGTTNEISDSASYVFEDGEDEPDAAIFAKDDLSFNGTGSLTVTGNYKDAIKCKDDLKFISGTYSVTSVDDAIVGKDSVSVRDGFFQIISEGDGLKATNAEEADKGYVMIDGGSIAITASADGIVAETLLRINDGSLNIVSGELTSASSGADTTSFDPGQMQNMSSMGGKERPNGMRGKFDPNAANASESSEDTISTKGLKSYVDLIVAGSDLTITSADDAIHSDQNVTIENGTFSIASGDDGIHAEKLLTINNGNIDITRSYEGLEAFDIVINDGTIQLVSSDDGINAAGDADSASNPEDDEETSNEQVHDNFSDFRGAGGMMAMEDQGATLTINGGTITLIAEGDVIDINGDGIVNGGTIIAQGPTMGGNGTLDYASSFVIDGGSFWGVGSAQMAMNPSSETQGLIAGTVQQTITEGTEIIVKDVSGNVVTSLIVEKQGQWIGVSTPEIVKGEAYTLLVGDVTYSATAS